MTPEPEGPHLDDLKHHLRIQEEALLHRHREALRLLAGGVAHEFNNILTGMSGYADVALRNSEDLELTRRALDACRRGTRRGTEVVKRLEHFSAVRGQNWDEVDPTTIVMSTVGLVEHAFLHEQIRIETRFATLPRGRFDPSLLGIALMELLQNAAAGVRDLPPERRCITVATEGDEEHIAIRIEDQGTGMSAEMVERATDPFFTTRGPLANGPDPKAKGLGLAAAEGIVHAMGGTLALESAPETGTVATIRLPSAASAENGRAARILVVDDEASSRRILTRILERSGYECVAAENGQEALTQMLEEPFDLVFLDQCMPEMTGTELLASIQPLRSDRTLPPVVMVTAHYIPDLAREALRLGAVSCASKPIRRAKIAYLARRYTGRGGPYHEPVSHLPEVEPGEKILLVDPDPMMRDVLELVLQRSDYTVTAEGDGEGAVRATENEYFNLILLDLLLHDRAGVQVVRDLRLNNPYTPILLTTPYLSGPAYEEAVKAGATQAVAKPVCMEGLLAEIRHLLATFREATSGES